MPTAALDWAPNRPMDWKTKWRQDVTLVPWGTDAPGGARRAAGLFDADGTFLPEGHAYRYADGPITTEPDLQAPQERLDGKWLFGGLFYGHFGHFLCETTSRLWAVRQLEDLDGVVFYPKQALTHERRQIRHQLGIFEALGLSHLAIRAPQKPVSIERIALPPPGFGVGAMCAGRPEYRADMRARLEAAAPADGPEALYVSRARLPSKRGSVLLEDRIERLMEAAGYTIFHPQEHDIRTQIARWKAARRIVSLDGSALHLAAMAVVPETRVAILNRGPSQNIDDYVRQFRHFAEIDPLRVDAVSAFYHEAGRRVVKRETHAVLDLPTIGSALAQAGFIPDAAPWQTPREETVSHAAAHLAALSGKPLSRQEA